MLYESSHRFGGVLLTERVDDCLVEAGPDSFLTEKPWAADLCRRLGLAHQLIGSNDLDRKTYILVRGKLVPIPDGLMFMIPTEFLSAFVSPLFSFNTKLRIIREWFHSPRATNGDETVATLVERHYGTEMLERLVDPLLAGIYGGEVSQLSVRAVLPRFVDMESKYGSLGRGMVAARKSMKRSKEGSPSIFTSLKDGLQQLPQAIQMRLSAESLRAGSPVRRIQREDRGWSVATSHRSDHFDAVIVATPAPVAATLLNVASPELASELRAIPYSSSVTVTFGFGKEIRDSLPPGFGLLVPRNEGKRVLAVTFVHNKFPYRAPENCALIRYFLGGSRDEQVLQLSDDEIVRIGREELRQLLGVTAEPHFTRVYRWDCAMAQYTVGHLERLERIERLRQQLRGLALAGNGYRGIGVPDCIRSGEEAAAELMVSW